MKQTIIVVLLLFFYGHAEIIHQTATIGKNEVLNIVENEISVTPFTNEHNPAEHFVLHIDSVGVEKTEERRYVFLQRALLSKLPLSSLAMNFNPKDYSIFVPNSSKTPLQSATSTPYNYQGAFPGANLFIPHEDSINAGIDDIPIEQVFLLRTNSYNYLLARIKTYYTSFKDTLYSFDVDSLELETWIQTDGSTDFTAMELQPPAPTNFEVEQRKSNPKNYYKFSWDPVQDDSVNGYQIYLNHYPIIKTTATLLEESFYDINNTIEELDGSFQYLLQNDLVSFTVKALYGAEEKETSSSEKVIKEVVWFLPVTQTSSHSQSAPFVQKSSIIQFSQELTGTATLFTMQGKELLKREIQSGTILNLEQLPSQYYILSVESQQGIKQYQILKQ